MGKHKDKGSKRKSDCPKEKAARKHLIAQNKAWDAATTVRRTWLAGFLARKSMPKDAAAVVASVLLTRRRMIGDAQGDVTVRDLLGLDAENRHGDHGVADWLATRPKPRMCRSRWWSRGSRTPAAGSGGDTPARTRPPT